MYIPVDQYHKIMTYLSSQNFFMLLCTSFPLQATINLLSVAVDEFAFCRTLSKSNHTVCTVFGMASLIQHNQDSSMLCVSTVHSFLLIFHIVDISQFIHLGF